ncbi:DM13 domain-containing protein [Leptolyngbya sp. O-77]|uniref:DM13 domain-containing protein n=1 Tax=Leptolyngbya sp. O-77 TaxID=1080068 RepID=UPI00074D48B4|nr:DM13 domain-containing protein [Leptolyngbya sp. O-77]BAU42716.1 Electron transfer DM13 [Leptolyngbya sp. O-77]
MNLYRASLGLVALAVIGCASQVSVEPSPAEPTAAATPEAVAPSPGASLAESPTTVAANPSVLKSGTFVSGEHPTQGTARIVMENGQRFLEFGSDFRTDSGPDLTVILHRSADVIGSTTPPAYAIREGDYVVLAELQQTQGTQRYLIPDGVNLDDFNSTAVWCRQFNATFGAAGLS